MVAVLLDHLARHHPLVGLGSGRECEAVDVRQLLPDDETGAVAHVEERVALRIVRRAHGVGAHKLDPADVLGFVLR